MESCMKNVLFSVIFNIMLMNAAFAQVEITWIAEPGNEYEYGETCTFFIDSVNENLPQEYKDTMPDRSGIWFGDKRPYTPPMIRFLSQLPTEEKLQIKNIVQKYQLQMQKLELDMRPTMQMLQNSISMYRLNLTRLTILPQTETPTNTNNLIEVFTNGRDAQGNLVDLRQFSDFNTAASKTNVVKPKATLGEMSAAETLAEIATQETQLENLQSLYDRVYQIVRKDMHKEIMDVVNNWIAKNAFMTEESLAELFSEAENQYTIPKAQSNTLSLTF